MISNRPYLIRALYEWIVDNGWTPYVQVDAEWPGVQVPQQFVHDGVIVLNIGPLATRDLTLGNDEIRFRARFQGEEQVVHFPPQAVLAIFAKENGQGMPFPPEPYPEEASEPVAEKPAATAASEAGSEKVVQFKPRRK
ncbi:stringent starvation protein B [Sulfurivirga caldicuralii]|uniref:Stringent starvation protein B n=1 Tax=Sulfurivirga caldicuralii TaxID=364032 RepID=A0A1N6EK01_9GAMM|nr:ClpXP protease specificity-enhancing factor [Sulfurivirga caldicuralii]SIN83353.1 stringent starvation protein B [Sulfurivirga caldicuralii]